MEKDQTGVKIDFPVTIGYYEGFGDTEVASIVPGVEAQIPISDIWTLKPFGNLGGGKDYITSENSVIFSLGIKGNAVLPYKLGRFRNIFGASVKYGGYIPEGRGLEDYTTLSLGLDIVHPLFGLKIRDIGLNFGPFFIYYYHPLRLELERFEGDPVRIEHEYEIGFSVGTYEKIRILIVSFDRVSLSYRFSGEIKILKVSFEFPF